jgi:hypothetical protein
LQTRKVIDTATEIGLPNAVKVMDGLINQRANRFMVRSLQPSSTNDATGIYVSRSELQEVRDRLKGYAVMLKSVRHSLRVSGGRNKGHFGKAVEALHSIALNFTKSAMDTAKRQPNGRDWVQFVQTVLKLAEFKNKGKDIQLTTIAKEIRETKPKR